MKSKFIADIHISPLTIKELQKKGYDIIRVTDKLPATSLDKEIIHRNLDIKGSRSNFWGL